MNPHILTQEDLAAMTGYERPSDIAKCLREKGIWYTTGKGGRVFTLVDAVKKSAGLLRDEGEAEKVEF